MAGADDPKSRRDLVGAANMDPIISDKLGAFVRSSDMVQQRQDRIVERRHQYDVLTYRPGLAFDGATS